MHLLPNTWTRDITRVLAQPPGEPQLQTLTHWLQSLAPTDHVVLFVNEGHYPPQPLYYALPPERRRRFIDDYRSGPYLLDPFYLSSLFDKVDGLYSLRDLAREGFESGHYFLTYYHRLRLSDQVGFFTTPEPGCRAVLSLMRATGKNAYDDATLRLLHDAMPVVEDVVRLAWTARSQPPAGALRPTEHVRAVFSSFGEELLTRREHTIAQLMLQGYSSLEIARQLRIAWSTVKVHRRNLYEKLEVDSQAQLFGLFMGELLGAGLFSRPKRRQRRYRRQH